MKSITVRGVIIGEGLPKIIAPIVGTSESEILGEALQIAVSGADIVEWRIDHFISGTSAEAVCRLARRLRQVIGEMPLLVTFRTKNEGGAREIAPEAYAALLAEICRRKAADMIDVEAFSGGDAARQTIACARENGVRTVASNHDFEKTPPQPEILRRLQAMAEMGADIAKIAVMPREKRDVRELLNATAEASERLDCPVITMSMGQLGVISRLSGESFGSACTFGSVGRESAPGQLPVNKLRTILRLLHG